MTIPNFSNTQEVTHRVFCSGPAGSGCPNEASGEIRIEMPDGTLNVPICEECIEKLEAHVQALLDSGSESVIN